MNARNTAPDDGCEKANILAVNKADCLICSYTVQGSVNTCVSIYYDRYLRDAHAYLAGLAGHFRRREQTNIWFAQQSRRDLHVMVEDSRQGRPVTKRSKSDRLQVPHCMCKRLRRLSGRQACTRCSVTANVFVLDLCVTYCVAGNECRDMPSMRQNLC